MQFMLVWFALVGLAAAYNFNISLDQDPDVYALPYLPIVVPLAVRGPYLGAYLSGRQHKNIAQNSPTFWTTAPLGWTGLARIDGQVRNLLGNVTEWAPLNNASHHITAASSSFVLTDAPYRNETEREAGLDSADNATVSITLSFISPVTPTDLLRQSLPFSYVTIRAASLDGKPHRVQLYHDINGLWACDSEDNVIEWARESDDEAPFPWEAHRFRLQNQRPFQEESDRILEGDVWYANADIGRSVKTRSVQGHDAATLRRHFAQHGSLPRSDVSGPRPIRTRDGAGEITDEPVFAFSHELGEVSNGPPHAMHSSDLLKHIMDPHVLLAIGHVRSPLVRFMTRGADGGEELIPLRPLWHSTFESPGEALSAFLADFGTAARASDVFNTQLYDDARRVHSTEYGHIVAYSTRQIFMALENVWDEAREHQVEGRNAFPKRRVLAHSDVLSSPETDTLHSRGQENDGSLSSNRATPPHPSQRTHALDTPRAMTMLKEISSNGNVQTIDVLAPMLPFLVYAAPQMITSLLEPIYRYMDTGFFRPVTPPHDLGMNYPNATGHNDFLDNLLPIEESANMMAFALAEARWSPPFAPILQYLPRLIPEDSLEHRARVKRGEFDIEHDLSASLSETHPKFARHASASSQPAHKTRSLATMHNPHAHLFRSARHARDFKEDFSPGAILQIDEKFGYLDSTQQQTAREYRHLKQWAGYLTNHTLVPELQRSTDDFFGRQYNLTSLVLKGVVGVRLMAQIAGELELEDDFYYYRNISLDLAHEFLRLATSADKTHLLGRYGNESSYMTHYNMYLDVLFETHVFPDSVYRMQEAFYLDVAFPFGPPLDSSWPERAKTDWMMWAAGATRFNQLTKDMFVNSVAQYFRHDANAICGDSITPQDGWSVGFLSRPVVGGHFSLLAIDPVVQERWRLIDYETRTVLSEIEFIESFWFYIRHLGPRYIYKIGYVLVLCGAVYVVYVAGRRLAPLLVTRFRGKSIQIHSLSGLPEYEALDMSELSATGATHEPTHEPTQGVHDDENTRMLS